MPTSTLNSPKKGRSISMTVVRSELGNPAGVTKGSSFTTRIPAVSTTFFFASRCSSSGLKFLASAAVFLGAAAFLLSEVSQTPLLRLPIVTVSVICIVLGLALAHLGIRNLLGRLRVDSKGIRLSPFYFGFNVPWNELRSWNMDGFTFHFRKYGSKVDLSVDNDHLTAKDSDVLRQTLLSCAANKQISGDGK
ncbi:MAG: hypothetical protein K8U03_25880 [Planctomycetia bacterium]|nr:hypothetical protein [Planctomycetia bacterium]